MEFMAFWDKRAGPIKEALRKRCEERRAAVDHPIGAWCFGSAQYARDLADQASELALDQPGLVAHLGVAQYGHHLAVAWPRLGVINRIAPGE